MNKIAKFAACSALAALVLAGCERNYCDESDSIELLEKIYKQAGQKLLDIDDITKLRESEQTDYCRAAVSVEAGGEEYKGTISYTIKQANKHIYAKITDEDF